MRSLAIALLLAAAPPVTCSGCASGPADAGTRPTIVEEERRAIDGDDRERTGDAAMEEAQERASARARDIQSQDLGEITREEKARAGGIVEEP